MSQTHLGFPYVINFSNLTQRWSTNNYVRSVRRVKQAPYPLIKIRLEEITMIAGMWVLPFSFCYNCVKLPYTFALGFSLGRRNLDLFKSGRQVNGNVNNAGGSTGTDCGKKKQGNGGGNRKKTQSKSKGASDTPTTNLARTILNNLNIFGTCFTFHFRSIIRRIISAGHKSSANQSTQHESKSLGNSLLDVDSSSTKSGRRPSLDTVSTYLSQESRESQATSSTADLLNCTTSSNDGVDNPAMAAIVGKSICLATNFCRVLW